MAMKIFFNLSVGCVVFSLFANPIQEQLDCHYIDFNESVHRGFSEEQYIASLKHKPQGKYLSILETIYERNNFLTKFSEQPIRVIPKIIHQIWLGTPLPERYQQLQETWRKFHPDWEYRLWTDVDVEDFHLINREAFDKSVNYAERANIWRYEILDRLGGLYIDTDFECLQPFELFHDFYEFYTGMATIDRLTLINNGLIASVVGHPILKACIEKIGKNDYGFRQLGRNGTIYFGSMVIETIINNELDLSRILICPPTYFYPWPGVKSGKTVSETLLPSSFAVHYWDSTWVGQTINLPTESQNP